MTACRHLFHSPLDSAESPFPWVFMATITPITFLGAAAIWFLGLLKMLKVASILSSWRFFILILVHMV